MLLYQWCTVKQISKVVGCLILGNLPVLLRGRRYFVSKHKVIKIEKQSYVLLWSDERAVDTGGSVTDIPPSRTLLRNLCERPNNQPLNQADESPKVLSIRIVMFHDIDEGKHRKSFASGLQLSP